MLLLRKYSGQAEFTIGFPYADRGQKEFAEVMGYFVYMLPIRYKADYEQLTFSDFVRQVEQDKQVLIQQALPLYQIMQALYALGSGGFFGKGLGNSNQKLGPLPEAQNDMIFSIVCEELGVFGGILLIGLFVYLLYRLLFIARNAPDLYGSLMVTGIFGHVALQVILNICVVINLIPTTGVTLPFVSYGGTSALFLMMEMAIALSVSRRITLKDAAV